MSATPVPRAVRALDMETGPDARARRLVLMVTAESTALSFLRGYLAFLRDTGYDVTVMASSTGRLEQLAEAEGVHVAPVHMAREPRPLSDLRSVVRAAALLRRIRPEIVMAATPKASLLGMAAGRIVGVPVRIYQLWGLRSETESGPRRRVLELAERLTMRLATHVVANSPSLAEEAQRLAGARTIDVVGEGSSQGIDLERW